MNFPWLADHVVDVHKKAADPVARADAHLARITRWLAGEYVKAIAAGREALPLADMERLIVEAAGSGIFKADELPAIAWNETVNLDMRLLGRPYVIVHIGVARFDRIWERRGAHYVADAGMALLEAIANLARAGVMLPPPVVADLGNAEWAFMDGRNRYLYARAARMKVIPVAVPQEDAARLKNAAGLALPAATGGGAVPAGGLSRPYADLSDAIEHVGLLIANRFYSAVMAAGIASGEREAVRLARMLDVRQRTAKLETAIDFETPNTGALAELRLSSMRLIREFSDEQRAAVLAALRDGVARGVNPKEMARLFRGVVGLTSAQEVMVQNYQRALERAATDAAARANALGRALRDGRFDRTVAAAGRSGVPLTPEKIQQMVGRYRERFINMRATTIARTEALTAVHMSERAVWEEAVRRGDIAANEVEETWNAAHDAKTRTTHRLLDKQKRPMGTPFQSISGAKLRFPGDPLAPVAERVNCRCVITRNISAEPMTAAPTADSEALAPAAALEADLAEMEAAGIPREAAAQIALRGSNSKRKLWNDAFSGANDTARRVVNKAGPIEVGKGDLSSYNAASQFELFGRVIHEPASIQLAGAATPARATLAIFRHEMGHFIDDVVVAATKAGRTNIKSRWTSAKATEDVITQHETWAKVASDRSIIFSTSDDVAAYLQRTYGIARAELGEITQEGSVLRRFVSTYIQAFERETGIDTAKLIGFDDILDRAEFARAFRAGDAERVASILPKGHLMKAEAKWDAIDGMRHNILDLIGSVSRLEYGAGHGGSYYSASQVLARGLRRINIDGTAVSTNLYTLHVAEAWANWFSLYSQGPGERALLRMLLPGLNEAFEAILRTMGRASAK